MINTDWLTLLLQRLSKGAQADLESQFAAALRAKPANDGVRDRWLARVAEFTADAARAPYVIRYASAGEHNAANAALAAADAAEAAAGEEARTNAYETLFTWLIEEATR